MFGSSRKQVQGKERVRGSNREEESNPGNTSIRKLFSEEGYHEAILEFLKNTSVGRLKERVLTGGH